MAVEHVEPGQLVLVDGHRPATVRHGSDMTRWAYLQFSETCTGNVSYTRIDPAPETV